MESWQSKESLHFLKRIKWNFEKILYMRNVEGPLDSVDVADAT